MLYNGAMARGAAWRLIAIGLALGAGGRDASAHDLGLLARNGFTVSRSAWRVQGMAVEVEVTMPPLLAEHLADPSPVPVRVPDAAEMRAAVASGVAVTRGGVACGGSVAEAGLAAPDSWRIRLAYACPGGDDPILASLGFVGALGPSHRHLASVSDGGHSRTEVLLESRSSFEMLPGRGALPISFLWLGVEHILGGWDHLVFLFGLILLGGRFRSLLATVTAFTVAHSLTLALAALEVWSPGSGFVEPAIGATIAYVGVENLWAKEARGRWRVTFLLGLVHGFGFAGALAEAGLASSHVVPALLLFNLGVEAGQIAVLAVVLPPVLLARRREWVVRSGVPIASAGIALTGVVLVVTRVFQF
ncbi:MAG: HupE/UreJ family protein [Deltaproteobacteria bacterium]|nr:HupE/UreJ family protein [Deltaproteobacteria bacterium]